MAKLISNEEFHEIQRIEGNRKCADCNEVDPVWASIGFGTLICLNCAGFHRSLGVHITMVKSITLDAWEPALLNILRSGGNQQFRDYAFIYDQNTTGNINYSKFTKYTLPIILYYSEILKAKIEDREPVAYDAEYWSNVLPSSNRNMLNSSSSKKSEPVQWISDSATDGCMLCSFKFTFTKRRHHCRRCGKVVCDKCAPANNSRPILEWGLKDAVRHCKVCYKSPTIKWEEMNNADD